MKNTEQDAIIQRIEGQRNYFSTHKTKAVNFRLEQLKKLKAAILKNRYYSAVLVKAQVADSQ